VILAVQKEKQKSNLSGAETYSLFCLFDTQAFSYFKPEDDSDIMPSLNSGGQGYSSDSEDDISAGPPISNDRESLGSSSSDTEPPPLSGPQRDDSEAMPDLKERGDTHGSSSDDKSLGESARNWSGRQEAYASDGESDDSVPSLMNRAQIVKAQAPMTTQTKKICRIQILPTPIQVAPLQLNPIETTLRWVIVYG
jgi:hypothetical protein